MVMGLVYQWPFVAPVANPNPATPPVYVNPNGEFSRIELPMGAIITRVYAKFSAANRTAYPFRPYGFIIQWDGTLPNQAGPIELARALPGGQGSIDIVAQSDVDFIEVTSQQERIVRIIPDPNSPGITIPYRMSPGDLFVVEYI